MRSMREMENNGKWIHLSFTDEPIPCYILFSVKKHSACSLANLFEKRAVQSIRKQAFHCKVSPKNHSNWAEKSHPKIAANPQKTAFLSRKIYILLQLRQRNKKNI